MEPGDFGSRRLPLGALERPAAGCAHLWWLDLDTLGNPLNAAADAPAGQLSPRQQRTLRRFYLRLLLGAYLGVAGKDVRISRLVKGKPVLAGPLAGGLLDFSSAGSAGCCLIGVATSGSLGVDLEIGGRRVGDPARLARRYFSASEADGVANLEPAQRDDAFLRLWACKEAIVKAAGHGIANQLHRFTVAPGPPVELASMNDDDVRYWRLAMVRPSDRHLGAVALRDPSLGDRPLRIEGFRLLAPRR